MRQVQRLVLVRLAAHDVVARELVLGPLQLVGRHRLAASAVELLDQRLLRRLGRLPRLDDGHRVEQVGILGDVAAAEGRQRQRFL